MKFNILGKRVEINKHEADHIRDRYLGNYLYLQKVHHEIQDEDLALKCLALEKFGKNREQMVRRLHTIYNQIRREADLKSLGVV